MKMNVGKRILMFLHWLLSLLICAAFVVHLFWPAITADLYQMLINLAGTTPAFFICIAVLAIYGILCITQVAMICQRNKKNRAERGFITVDSSDSSRVRIAISAIEQMVRQSVNNIDGITDMKISIENSDDAIAINIIASILNGCHVPTITMNMQQAIRKFVELNCGVAVRSVAVNINAVTSPDEQGRKKRRDKTSSAPVAQHAAAPFVSAAPIAPFAEESVVVPETVEDKTVCEETVIVEPVCEPEAASEENVEVEDIQVTEVVVEDSEEDR